MDEKEIQRLEDLNRLNNLSVVGLSTAAIVAFVCLSISISNINTCIEKGIFPDVLLPTNSSVKTAYSVLIIFCIAYLIAYLVIVYR